MLNKKIVSFISALTMALSMCSFVSVQAADVPAADLEFKVEKNIFDQETFDAGYQEYTITVNLLTENIGLTDNGKSGALKRYTGSRVTSLAGRILFDNTVFYTDNSMISTLIPSGNPFIAPYEEGVTFNWYCGDYTTGLEGESIELFKINLYGMNEDGDITIDADADFESMFAWDTTNRSVSYCEWENAKAAEMAVNEPKVLGDLTTEAGWIGNLGIAKEEVPADPITITKEYGDVGEGYAWDVEVNNYDDTKTYTATFTSGTEKKVNDFDFSKYIEAGGSTTKFSFVTLLKTLKENVQLVVSAN